MPLGTLDRTPPPFFRQGPSAATKLAFFSALALFLMVADTRLQLTPPLRNALATALLPAQRVAALPLDMLEGSGDYLRGLREAQLAEQRAQQAAVDHAVKLARAAQLERENERLRQLLELKPALAMKTVAAQVLYEASDPFTRKVFIDRGTAHGVVAGSAAVNEAGVLGQVTRVYPFSCEVTLLQDKDASIAVLNSRTQQRALAGGGGAGGRMELRYTPANADVRAGDLFATSGLDGVYPAGLPVATVRSVDRRGESGFARVVLTPSAMADNLRFVLLVEPNATSMALKPSGGGEGAGPTRAGRAAARSAAAAAAASAAASAVSAATASAAAPAAAPGAAARAADPAAAPRAANAAQPAASGARP